MRALLARVAEGDGAGVVAELNRLTYPRVQIPVGQAMRCTAFAAKTIETREVRHKKEAEAAAAKRQREAELRKQHLASVLRRADGQPAHAGISTISSLMGGGMGSPCFLRLAR